MLCAIHVGGELYKKCDLTPLCEDYCDCCGDCLSCNGEDPCQYTDDGEHMWVEEFEMVEQADAFVAERGPGCGP